jgi:hypothetical protein
MLSAYDIHPAGNVRIGEKVVKSYRRVAFDEAWARYLGASEPLQGNKPNKTGPESPIPGRYTEPACSALQSVTNRIDTEACSGVAVREGGGDLPEATWSKF